MRPLQNQVTDMAVFGLSVAFLGFLTQMVRDLTADVLSDKSPVLLPATTKEPWQTPAHFLPVTYLEVMRRIIEKYSGYSPEDIMAKYGWYVKTPEEFFTSQDDTVRKARFRLALYLAKKNKLPEYKSLVKFGWKAYGSVMADIEAAEEEKEEDEEESENEQSLSPQTYHSISRDELRRIADKYGWWAARQAEALCPHNDVACVEREARRLIEVVKYRKGA